MKFVGAVLIVIFIIFLFIFGCITPPVCGNGVCEIGETNENCPTDCGVQLKLPDLTIEDINISKMVIANQEVYTYSVYVKNNSNYGASKSSVKVSISPIMPQMINIGESYDCSSGAIFPIPGNELISGDFLPAGQTESAHDYFTSLFDGEITITATADFDGDIEEQNEENNVFEKTFLVEALISENECPELCEENICRDEEIFCYSDNDCDIFDNYEIVCDGNSIIKSGLEAFCQFPGEKNSDCLLSGVHNPIIENCEYGCENATCTYPSCNEVGGQSCGSSETCWGDWIDQNNIPNCCQGYCYNYAPCSESQENLKQCYSNSASQTCVQKNGEFIWSYPNDCSAYEECVGNGVCQRKEYPYKIAVIEFQPQDINYGGIEYCCRTAGAEEQCFYTTPGLDCDLNKISISFLEILNNPDNNLNYVVTTEDSLSSQSPKSLFYINEFMQSNSENYLLDINESFFDISVLGPFDLNEDPPITGRDASKSPFVVNFFDERINDLNINLENFDMVAILFFNDFQQAGGYPGFTSFADPKVVYLSLETSNSHAFIDDKVHVFIHEMTHFLGAIDKYVDPCDRGPYTSCCIIPDGIPDPLANPLYPQEKACVMCGSIMQNANGQGMHSNRINTSVICQKTAQEIGWVN
jgi:hypothetical protein